MKSKYVFLVGTDNSMKEFRQTMRRAMKVQEFLTVNKAPNVKKKKKQGPKPNQTKPKQNHQSNLHSKSTLKNSNELFLLDLAVKDC